LDLVQQSLHQKFLLRIREREAEFQKQVLERDDQIGRLKERLHILSSKVTKNSPLLFS
jgi:hypothetical protein